MQKKNHETLSKLIFKKILLDNPKVLATFVSSPYGLDKDDVIMIEEMIVPPIKVGNGYHELTVVRIIATSS